MNIKTYLCRFADEIVSAPGYYNIKNEILNICYGCPIPAFGGKSVRRPPKDAVRQIMDTSLRLQFDAYGWEFGPLATPDDFEDAFRTDFQKTFNFQSREPITAHIDVDDLNNKLDIWDIRGSGVPLDVAQNKNKSIHNEHEESVRPYIEWLNTQ